MKKKAIAFLLAFVLALSSLATTAFADYADYTDETYSTSTSNWIYFKDANGNDYGVNKTVQVSKGSSYTGYVCVIQSLLNQFYYHTANSAYYVGTIDGDFGTKTYNAVKTFQANMGLSPIDGIVGVGTWTTFHDRWEADLGSCNLPGV